MNYYLMHKDDKAILLDIDVDTGKIIEFKILENDLAPSYIDNLQAMNSWWSSRAIPKSRSNIMNILQKCGIETTESLILQNLALNLSDCYWVKPIDDDIKYKEVNFYENDFDKVDFASFSSQKYTKEKLLREPPKTQFTRLL